MAKISIIIPCYNVENYIDRCLESVVNQTIGIENLEIIVINDASTDDTLKKMYEWEQRYPNNILVITYENNIRQGGARNVGMEYATSDYIGFVDSDDWISLDMYQLLYEKMQSGSYDAVKCRFVREHFPGELDLDSEAGESGSICTGLYKRTMISENGIWFPENLAYEDNFWGSIMGLYIKHTGIVDRILYHYFINVHSTVTSDSISRQLERLTVEELLVEEYKKRGFFEAHYREIEYNFIKRYYLNTWYIVFTRVSFVPDIFSEMKATIERTFPDYRNNPYLNEMNAREKQLFRMLEMNHTFTLEELERIKYLYLQSM